MRFAEFSRSVSPRKHFLAGRLPGLHHIVERPHLNSTSRLSNALLQELPLGFLLGSAPELSHKTTEPQRSCRACGTYLRGRNVPDNNRPIRHVPTPRRSAPASLWTIAHGNCHAMIELYNWRRLNSYQMPAGLRRGELAGLKSEDLDFNKLNVSVTRSPVDQHVGPVKTEASRKLMPIDEYIAQDLLAWYEVTHTSNRPITCGLPMQTGLGPNTASSRFWLSTVMRDHIQPIARRLGITKKLGWHTFRHTVSSILKANGEDVKVVQELLRHSTSRMTLDT